MRLLCFQVLETLGLYLSKCFKTYINICSSYSNAASVWGTSQWFLAWSFLKILGNAQLGKEEESSRELVLSPWRRYKRLKLNQFHGILSFSSQGKAVWGDSCTISKTNKIINLNLSRMDLVACAWQKVIFNWFIWNSFFRFRATMYKISQINLLFHFATDIPIFFQISTI